MSVLHADVAVIGNELCGYAAAALLAHGRRRVVVIDDGEGDDAKPLGDRLVPTSTSLWRPPASGPAAELMEQLGLRQRVRHELGDAIGLSLIDDPDVRVVLPPDPGERLAELQRAFGEAGPRLQQVMQGFPADGRDALVEEAALLFEVGLLERYRAKKRVQRLGNIGDLDGHDPVAAGLGVRGPGAALPHLLPFVQHLAAPPAHGLAGYLGMAVLSLGTAGNGRCGLGLRSSLRALFSEVVQGHTGDVLRDTGAVELVVDKKRVLQVNTDGQNQYRVRAVIDATTGRTLSSRLPASRPTDALRAQEQLVPMTGGAASVRWLLPRAFLPRGLPSRALVLSEEEGLPSALLGVYSHPPPLLPSKKMEDDVAAVVLAARCEDDRSHEVAKRLDERLERLMPFAQRHCEARDHVVGTEAKCAMPTYQPASTAQHSLRGRRPTTPFSNLFRAGRDLAPALGIDGELAAARAVATAAQRVLSKGVRLES
ncbi:MAG: hypothetical protein ACO3JL_12260 [Myxococcota bacterium]